MADTHAHPVSAARPETSPGGRLRPVYDDINVPVLVMIGIVSAIVTFLIVAGVQGLAYHLESAFEKANNRNSQAGVRAIRQIIDGQRALLDGGEAGATVPIGTAMDRVVERYAARQKAEAGRDSGHGDSPADHSDSGHSDLPATGGDH